MHKKLLCFRCENRIRYLEQEHEKKGSGNGPRYECQTDFAVHSCYAFKPVQPVVVQPSDYEKRLKEETGVDRGLGGMIGGRMCVSDKQPEFDVIATQIEGEQYLIENKMKDK